MTPQAGDSTGRRVGQCCHAGGACIKGVICATGGRLSDHVQQVGAMYVLCRHDIHYSMLWQVTVR
jgi:hypothetical protein